MAAAWLSLGLLSGCYAGGVDVQNLEFVDTSAQPSFEPACHDTFSPEQDLVEVTQWALNKWETVTGKTLCIGEGGVPMVRVPEVIVDDKSVCGNTNTAWGNEGQYLFTNYIEVSDADLGCVSQARIVLHEVGHAIAHHPYGVPIHTEEYGVMATRTNSTTDIDAPAIELVCANSDCPVLETL